ncbi:PIR Superfamily Protein [Plasmodium ovale curtisi]|uniref:PIR Superfamily Protein n=1 Tax=Plasmodium ovale curtisi TaxID=864141 RepID=A0A1A8X6G6_PLAOA|nr:PIR Superfamily Protein [Plasmodium ovale curtisi]
MSLQANSTELFALHIDSEDLSKYYNQCNDIHVHNPKEKVIKICKKYLRYLEYCKLLHYDNSLYKVSVLFNYCLYRILTYIYGFNSTEQIRTGFSALQLKWTYFDYRRINEPYYLKCKPNFEIVNHNDWDKRKKLYDYYVDYDILIVDPIGPVTPGLVTGFEIEVIPQNYQIGTEVGHSVLAVAPVLLTFTAFYRYKPLGSWVRKLRGYSPNSINDMDGYSIDTEPSCDMLFDGSANYISYQPM